MISLADNIKNINAAAIDEVEFPTCVRLRRGMYISNRNQMVTEIIDNSIDEHFAGYCNTIAVIIKDNKRIIIQDDGRGIPIAPSKKDPSKTQLEIAFTKLHAGGKFGLDKNNDGYTKKTSGMNGKLCAVVKTL